MNVTRNSPLNKINKPEKRSVKDIFYIIICRKEIT